MNPDRAPIFKFNKDTGEVMTSFGAGLFVLPHGLHVDTEGNVWVTDSQGNEAGTKGHQVIKFSPDGEILMRLGTAGQPGSGTGQLNEPCDVITAPNGDIFVADGHSGQNPDPPPGTTGRIVKFDREGNFIMEWGELGFRPGQFRTPHALDGDFLQDDAFWSLAFCQPEPAGGAPRGDLLSASLAVLEGGVTRAPRRH